MVLCTELNNIWNYIFYISLALIILISGLKITNNNKLISKHYGKIIIIFIIFIIYYIVNKFFCLSDNSILSIFFMGFIYSALLKIKNIYDQSYAETLENRLLGLIILTIILELMTSIIMITYFYNKNLSWIHYESNGDQRVSILEYWPLRLDSESKDALNNFVVNVMKGKNLAYIFNALLMIIVILNLIINAKMKQKIIEYPEGLSLVLFILLANNKI